MGHTYKHVGLDDVRLQQKSEPLLDRLAICIRQFTSRRLHSLKSESISIAQNDPETA